LTSAACTRGIATPANAEAAAALPDHCKKRRRDGRGASFESISRRMFIHPGLR